LKSLALAFPKIFKIGHVTLITPLSGTFCHRKGEINLPIKFDFPTFASYGDMKGVAKCRKWGGLGSPKVISNVTIP